MESGSGWAAHHVFREHLRFACGEHRLDPRGRDQVPLAEHAGAQAWRGPDVRPVCISLSSSISLSTLYN